MLYIDYSYRGGDPESLKSYEKETELKQGKRGCFFNEQRWL
ncbi:unnamed protein product [marine sediment metagenome]|uniref:Uncharacterized protein n=1 Tax=marine sediment metagenome TaxID=412755 RepID=X0WD82_9ZZZZ